MKSIVISLLLTALTVICVGQDRGGANSADGGYVSIYVTQKGEVILNREKTGLHGLERYLEETKFKKAKIGSVKPTPMKVFAVFEEVVELCEKFEIETEWFRDPEFTQPFFDEE